ncbi:YLP motif-containing protein 1-like [Brachionichthys hirsutus]|uniref:YLP motif-containing protein 1-like n=1 Tax=Brachionichthys hirsutus TaxID=412623 RepID=UPI0036051AB5
MYPSWGNSGGAQPQNHGGPRMQFGSVPAGQAGGGFGTFEPPSNTSLFSSLQEQHRQQMQQLQMLHQKQLQSVLHHGNHANAFGAGHSGGYPGTSWRPEGPGHAHLQHGHAQQQQQQQQQQPPPPKQPSESQPPEPPSSKPPESSDAQPKDDKPSPLPEQQQLWYKHHLQNLQKLKQEKAQENQKDGAGLVPPPPTPEQAVPPPPSETPKGIPPPPPPKEEPPAPPPPPADAKPEVPQNPEEAARLQQLQAAAAQWQQVQQQRAGLQYQALMQQHEKLQQILEKYHQLIQPPANLQSLSTEMQLKHYEMQLQQFLPLFQEWHHSFILWHQQFQTYHHKDQLQDYALQWKQWLEQMNTTNAHLQERVATLTAMVPFASNHYKPGIVGQYGQNPGQDVQIPQQPVKPDLQQSPVTSGPRPEVPRPDGFGPHSESPAGPPVRGVGPAGTAGPPDGAIGAAPTIDPPLRGAGPAGIVRPPGPPTGQSPRFNNIRGQWGNASRFDQPQQRFDVPPRFNQPQQRFDRPVRFEQPRQPFDGAPRFDQTRQRFDAPPRFDKPQFGQQSQFQHQLRHPSPTVPQQLQQPGPQLDAKLATNRPSIDSETSDSKTPGKSAEQPQSEREKGDSKPKKNNAEDMMDDNLLGTEGFFVANAPIPQTLKTDKKPAEPGDKNASNNEKPKADNSKPSVTTTSTVGSKHTTVQDLPKAAGPLTKNKPLIPAIPGIQKEIQVSGQIQSRPDPPQSGIGCGQPSFPVEFHGRGRGQMVCGEFTEPNTVSLGENMGETSYDCIPSEEDMETPEEQEQSHWQEPSYEEFGDEESEMPPEDMWMPEEHYFQTEEEYYEEPRGGPPMGRGGPSFMRGGPPMGRGGPFMGRGGQPMGRGGPFMGRGGPFMGRGGPFMGRGGPFMGRGGPPMRRGGPPMRRGGTPMGRGGPPMGRGGPPFMGRGGPESEYSEDVDPYWGERRPPMRGMRPPFPPGRGRPPRGHPNYMHPVHGQPPDAQHWPIDHETLGHNLESDYTEMEPAHDSRGYLMDHDAARGKHRVPRSHQDLKDVVEEPYDEGMEGELDWQTPHGRGRPLHPHEMDSGGVKRRPSGRIMARGMMRPGPPHGDYEVESNEGYVKDYGHRKEGHHWRHPDGHLNEAKYHGAERDREYASLERSCPPAEPYRDGHWLDERDRGHPYPHDEHDRGRGELRIHDYRSEPGYQPSPSEWERSSRLPALPERRYPDDFENRRTHFEEHGEQLHLHRLPNVPPAAPVTNLPESSVDSEPEGTGRENVLALSQHQHEIILKAAQELKFIRELKEAKTPGTDPHPAATNTLPELPAGLLGLEIPPDIRNVLKGMTAAAQTSLTEALSLDTRSAATGYKSTLPAAPTPTVIPKTVDYGHGHEPGATVEQTPYGERIILRPDPMHSNRGYEKEHLGSRDPYRRDPYFEKRSDHFLDRREYSRERELYREMLPSEYERERFDRERYPPRERDGSTQSNMDDRSPLEPPLHSGYRERDRNLRDKERRGSRDRDEHYGRPGNDRPPYERDGLDRSGSERYGHSASPYLDRRSYPEDRGPPSAPTLPPAPQPPPRVEKKPEIKNIDDILKPPGRLARPERIVVIMRGLPGSGKSHVAKLIRDKEVDCGGAPPRVLVLDDYFMTEVDKVQKDPDTGRGVKTKVLEYEYEPEMEDTYRSSMLKTFKKTLDDGFFPFIILDTINDKVKHFDQFWSAAKTKGFEVYVAEITADTQTCAKRNVHGRTLKDILKMSNNWEASPRHMVRLDIRSLLQDAAIEEVEMEDFNPDDEPKEPKGDEEEESDLGYIPKSKWEMDTSEAKLDKLDGLGSSGKRKREDPGGLDDFLQLPDDYASRMSEPGKKRVRWADLEEQKEADRKRAIGFVMGQTDWERITDESGQLAQRALNRTKYF